MKKTWGKVLALWRSKSRRQRIILLTGSGTVVVAIVILLILLTGKESRSRLDLLPYTSNSGGFTIDAPDGILVMTQEKISFLGKSLQQFSHIHEKPGVIFKVSHFDLPSGIINPEEKSNLLNHLAAEFLVPIHGVVNSTADIEIQGYSGIRINASGMIEEKEMTADGLILVIDNRLYIIGVYAEKGKIRQKHIHAFLASLRFNF